MITFNAWRDPWLPVRTVSGEQVLVPLRRAFDDTGELAALGEALTPLDRDSIFRLLPSIAAVIARGLTEDEWPSVIDGAGFPEHALVAFEEQFEERFNLAGEDPFLQRWDRTQTELAALFSLEGLDAQARKKREGERASKLRPLDTLHPHVPGKSSSQWAVRRDERDPADPAILTVLLTTAWFQTKHGNSRDPWGNKSLKGSAGTWHVNPLALHLVHPTSLVKTVLANTPAEWTERSDLPLFLQRGALPADFATAYKTSVARFTYAKTLPLVLFEDGRAVGFVSGADDTVDVPKLGGDEKESLGLVHAHDHTRLYVRRAKKGQADEIVPRPSFGARLSSTEGFERWFRADNRVSEAVAEWQVLPRVLSVGSSDLLDWSFVLLSDNGDSYGTREWTAWDELPADFASATGGTLASVQALLQFAAECRTRFVHAGRIATGESGVPALAVSGQVAFYTALMPVILALADDVHASRPIDMQEYSQRVARTAVVEFERATAPLLVPSRVADVARARAQFARLIHRDRSTRFAVESPVKENA